MQATGSAWLARFPRAPPPGPLSQSTVPCPTLRPTKTAAIRARMGVVVKAATQDGGSPMAEIISLLEQLGFTEYEGRAYVALCEKSPLNGYELAKISGLPRANVYAVLQKLEDRGAVVRVETPGGVQYAPVPPADLARQLERRFAGALRAAEEALSALETPAPPASVWNVAGDGPLLDRARGLLGAA